MNNINNHIGVADHEKLIVISRRNGEGILIDDSSVFLGETVQGRTKLYIKVPKQVSVQRLARESV